MKKASEWIKGNQTGCQKSCLMLQYNGNHLISPILFQEEKLETQKISDRHHHGHQEALPHQLLPAENHSRRYHKTISAQKAIAICKN